MRLEDMKYFVEVARTKSINKASKVLFVAQPAISRAIAAMEKELGFPLLERSNQGITLTQEGNIVYEDCVNMLRTLDSMEKKWATLAYHHTDASYEVYVVALPVACNNTMIEAFRDISSQYPRILPMLVEKQLDTILETTVEKQGICISHYNEKNKGSIYEFARAHDMQIVPMFDDTYKFFVREKHPLGERSLLMADLVPYGVVTYANKEIQDAPAFTEAGLNSSKLSEHFASCTRLSNRNLINAFVASSDNVCMDAEIMTSCEYYHADGSLRALDVEDHQVEMTFFMMLPQNPDSATTLVADFIRQKFHQLYKSFQHH